MVNGHSFILIRQMAALIRRALAAVCTVPMLLFFHAVGALIDQVHVDHYSFLSFVFLSSARLYVD